MAFVGFGTVSLSIQSQRSLETFKQGAVRQGKPALARETLVLSALRCHGERVTTKLLHSYTGGKKLGSPKQMLLTAQLERPGTRDYLENMQE